MLTDLSVTYEDRADAPTSEYPQGKPRNETTEGAGDGTPVDELWINDLWGAQSAIIKEGGVTPSNIVETADASDVLQALQNIIDSRTEGWIIGAPVTFFNRNSFSVAGQSTNPEGLSFKPDGKKMFIVDSSTDTVYEYDLGTPWDVASAVYNGGNFSVFSQQSQPKSVTFKSDGTKMFIVGQGPPNVHEYDLGTPWDVASAVYNAKTFVVGGQELFVNSVTFKSDGTKMFIVGDQNDTVYEYDLGTPWDVTSSVYNGGNFSVSSQETLPESVTFKSDGTKMFIVGNFNDTVYEYDLDTPWDVTSSAYNSNNFSIKPQDGAPSEITFKPDGKKMFLIGPGTDTVYEYNSNFLKAS